MFNHLTHLNQLRLKFWHQKAPQIQTNKYNDAVQQKKKYNNNSK